MAKKLVSYGVLLAAILCLAALGVADDSLSQKCAAEFTKVTNCLPFATAKAAVPTRECCGAVTDLRGTDPACLCYIIQQVHNGSNAAVKSMGIQESRLLQLPSACRLANASVSECPRLLHLPPNSPDAAIFNNVSTTVTTPVGTPGTAAPTTASSHAFWLKPQLGAVPYMIFVALAVLPSIGFLT